jgi:hypothetical protein
MQSYWKTLTLKIASWTVAEVILNLVGLDGLANYNEFLSKWYLSIQISKTSITIVL